MVEEIYLIDNEQYVIVEQDRDGVRMKNKRREGDFKYFSLAEF